MLGGCCGGLGLGGGAWGLSGWWINLALLLLFGGAVLWLALAAVRRLPWRGVGDDDPVASPTPKEILQQRYARGEITRDEYLSMLEDLT